jgi:RNA polymerase sporulation-specific sigma factor
MQQDRDESRGELLSHEQTLRLLKKVKEGDERAKELLVTKNIALVKSVVKRFLGRNLDYDDLFQLGCMGLVKAIINYDMSYNVRFSTYAVPLIMGEIRRFLRDDGAFKVARPVKELYSKAVAAAQRLGTQFGREPTVEEIAAELGCSREEIAQCFEAARMPVSLNAPLQDEGGRELTLDDCIGSEDKSELALNRVMLRELLSSLAPRERQVIFLRYFEDQTQSEIAAQLGISQVQVSRLESKIIKKLRDESGG